MKGGWIGAVLGLGLAGAAFAQTPSPATPTPATPGPNPGAAATDAITNPAKPAPIVSPEGGISGGGTTPAPSAPGAPSATPPGPPATPRPPTAAAPPPAGGEMADLVQSARAIAKNTRETVEYVRVQPDILQQVLAKLDKIENKLDKVEDAVKAQRRR